MYSRVGTSPSGKLFKKLANIDFITFQTHKLCDREFLSSLDNQIRNLVATASIREDNIKSYMETGRLNARPKEIATLKKCSDPIDVLGYLHSLDDATLYEVINDQSLKNIAMSDNALSQRISSIKSDMIHRNTSNWGGKSGVPAISRNLTVPFSLEIESDDEDSGDKEIKMVDDYEENMKALLSMTHDRINDYLDESRYIQDNVVKEIRDVANSEEYWKRKTLMGDIVL